MKTLQSLLLVTLVCWVGALTAYHLGASGLRFNRSATASFGRSHDYRLFEAASGVVLVAEAGADPAVAGMPVVNVTPPPIPFNWLCGDCMKDGFTKDHASARRVFGSDVTITPHPIPGERERVVASISPAQAAERYRPLRVCQESCLIFNAAFMLLVLAMGLVAGVMAWFGRSRD